MQGRVWNSNTPRNSISGVGQRECFNWFNALIDPIANDPNVYDDGSLLPSIGAGCASCLPLLGIGLIALAILKA